MKYVFLVFVAGLFVVSFHVAQVCAEEVDFPDAFQYPRAVGRDPFQPLVREEVTQAEVVENTGGFELLGITWNGRVSLALITYRNTNWLVSEGMQIADLKVDRIEGKRGEVVLSGDEKIVILRMLDI